MLMRLVARVLFTMIHVFIQCLDLFYKMHQFDLSLNYSSLMQILFFDTWASYNAYLLPLSETALEA